MKAMFPLFCHTIIWDKVFNSELSKFCGRQPLKMLKGYSLLVKIC